MNNEQQFKLDQNYQAIYDATDKYGKEKLLPLAQNGQRRVVAKRSD